MTAKKGQKHVKNGSEGPKKGAKRLKKAKNDPKRPKMIQNGRKIG